MNYSKTKMGEALKRFRVNRGLTQHDFAELVGLTEKQISKIETGVHYPKFENFVKMMSILNVSMRDFDVENVQEKSSVRRNIVKIINRTPEEDLKYYFALVKNIENLTKKYKLDN